jgi:hypothetical protein
MCAFNYYRLCHAPSYDEGTFRNTEVVFEKTVNGTQIGRTIKNVRSRLWWRPGQTSQTTALA